MTEVVVLDGGLPKWRREGRPMDDLVLLAANPPFHAAAQQCDGSEISRR